MLNLIKNEWIKVFKKKSTIIMFVGIIVMSLAILVFMKFMRNRDSEYYYTKQGESYTEDALKEDIAECKKETMNNDIKANIAYDEILLENKIFENDWKMSVVREAVYENLINTYSSEGEEKKKYEENYNKLCEIIKQDDYNVYLDYKIANEESKTYTCEILKDAITNQYQYMKDKNIKFDDCEYGRVNMIMELQNKIEELSKKTDATSKSNMEKTVKTYLLTKYKVDTGKKALTEVDEDEGSGGVEMADSIEYWRYFSMSTKLLILVSIFMLIIASSCVASEYSDGTIKFLIINPKKRGKIIASKYINLLIITLGSVIIFYIINALFCLILGGTGDLGTKYLYVINNKVCETSAFVKIAQDYALSMVSVVMILTMAFMISSLLKSSAVATGVGVGVYLGGSLVITIMSELGIDWGRYLLLSNTYLVNIKNGSGFFFDMTLPGAIINLVIHWCLFTFIAYDAFVRREV